MTSAREESRQARENLESAIKERRALLETIENMKQGAELLQKEVNLK
jgi:hypothetical protein